MNLINNKKLDLMVNIRDSRIWLPKSLQKTIKEDFIEIAVKDSCFLTKLTKDGRFFIPKRLRKGLSEGKTKVNVKILKNFERPNKHILNDKIDVLHFIPEKTMSGFDILALERNNKVILWYSTKGRPNEIIINRFVPLEFITLLGYYQAEGGKAKLRKRRGREINFTNTNMQLIEDFLRYSKLLLDIKLFRATIRYNPQLYDRTIADVKNRLISIGIEKSDISVKIAKRVKTFTVKVWITNSIIGEVIDNMVNQFRKILTKYDSDKKQVIYFLQGLLAGDGCFYSHRDKKGSLHSYLRVYDGNYDCAQDYKKIIDHLLGVNGIIRKDKNMYQYYIFANWNTLLKMQKDDIWCKVNEKNKRLINAIRNHRNNKLNEPVRKHFETNKKAKELLEQVKSFQVTR